MPNGTETTRAHYTTATATSMSHLPPVRHSSALGIVFDMPRAAYQKIDEEGQLPERCHRSRRVPFHLHAATERVRRRGQFLNQG